MILLTLVEYHESDSSLMNKYIHQQSYNKSVTGYTNKVCVILEMNPIGHRRGQGTKEMIGDYIDVRNQR